MSLKTFTLFSDAVIVAPKTFTLFSDAVIVAPKTFTLTSDAYIVGGKTIILHSNAYIVRVGHGQPRCPAICAPSTVVQATYINRAH